MNIEQKFRTVSISQMSGQEQQHQQSGVIEPINEEGNVERFLDLAMMASVAADPRSSNLLDYLFAYSMPISLLPLHPAGGGAAGGGAANNWNDIESAAAAILTRSLYDRHPVKKVITEEARSEIVDKKFTAAMVADLKINDVCGIWQESFEEEEDIKILPCNHAFKSEAIMKWLENEKAECPVCRFSLKSKEVNENQNWNREDDDATEDEDEDEDHEEDAIYEPEAHADADADPAPVQDNDTARINNIASRLVASVAGRINHPYPNHPVAVPMNQLIQSIRMRSSSSRLREPMRAALPSVGGAVAQPHAVSYANAGHEVRAEAIQRAADPVNNPNNNHNNNPNNNYNIINNNYYYYGMNSNNYHIDEAHQDIISNQEQDDIEEAIRRSLEQS